MLIPRRNTKPEPYLAHETIEEIQDINRNLEVILRLIDLADMASIAFALGEYHQAFDALTDYRSLRQEHVSEPLRI